jgi:TRAP-type C4-dicarboxylate transport system substrate-binding protein
VKKLLIILAALLVIGSVMAGCTATTTVTGPGGATATTTITQTPVLSTVKVNMPALGSPADQARVKDLQETADVIKDATDGRADVTIHYGDTLIPPADYYRGVTEGIADIAMVQPALNPGTFPLQGIFSLPGLFQTQSQSIFAMYDLYHKYPQFEKEFDPKVVVLSNFSLMTSDIHSRMPIRTLADLKGKNIVAQDETTVKILSALGANASIMPGSDMYLAAERGTIDGSVVPMGFFDGEKLYEQEKFHTQLNISPVAFAYVMNRNTFNKFTPTEQANLERSWFTLVRPTMSRNVGVIIKSATTYMATQEVFTFPKEDQDKIKELTKPMYDDWVKAMDAKGYPGADILKDAQLWCDAYLGN